MCLAEGMLWADEVSNQISSADDRKTVLHYHLNHEVLNSMDMLYENYSLCPKISLGKAETLLRCRTQQEKNPICHTIAGD